MERKFLGVVLAALPLALPDFAQACDMDKCRAFIAVLGGRRRFHTSDDPRSRVGEELGFVPVLHSVAHPVTTCELPNGARAFGLEDDISVLFNTRAAVGEEAIA
jgi:hypothetical protein